MSASVLWIFAYILLVPITAALTIVGVVTKACSSMRSEKFVRFLHEHPRDFTTLKPLRKEVSQETQRASGEGFVLGGQKVSIQDVQVLVLQKATEGYAIGALSNRLYWVVQQPKKKKLTPSSLRELEVVQKDLFALMRQYQDAKHKTVVLTMTCEDALGSDASEGGGVQDGVLHRRSNYARAFEGEKAKLYPIPQKHGAVVFTPGVAVFRGPETDFSSYGPLPIKAKEMAKCFKDVLEKEFQGFFKQVGFAIMYNPGLYQTFKETFSPDQTPKA